MAGRGGGKPAHRRVGRGEDGGVRSGGEPPPPPEAGGRGRAGRSRLKGGEAPPGRTGPGRYLHPNPGTQHPFLQPPPQPTSASCGFFVVFIKRLVCVKHCGKRRGRRQFSQVPDPKLFGDRTCFPTPRVLVGVFYLLKGRKNL